MLERIGGECAGAVTFMPAGQPLTENHYRELSQKALVAILKELPKRPLLAGRERVRLTSFQELHRQPRRLPVYEVTP